MTRNEIRAMLIAHFDKSGEKQVDFAKRAGVSPVTISEIMRGVRPNATMRKWSEARIKGAINGRIFTV